MPVSGKFFIGAQHVGWMGIRVDPAPPDREPLPRPDLRMRSTSVGTLSIKRFLRPVCFQDFPDALLPEVLKNDPPPLPRWVDGAYRLD